MSVQRQGLKELNQAKSVIIKPTEKPATVVQTVKKPFYINITAEKSEQSLNNFKKL